ncbi:hypothetical protein NHX12_003601 [Muraenolepis orangiensis]|uniref:Uncharacterized protein n=1 Tax=Muraenolepis orangiensis TaxID=630683 RepID=A0A9Q0DZ38_9TELE|nr:hypothetical protein NHX12_003601 [Muraenolepis orangiensis]
MTDIIFLPLRSVPLPQACTLFEAEKRRSASLHISHSEFPDKRETTEQKDKSSFLPSDDDNLRLRSDPQTRRR